MFYIVYKITNKINNKYYIGKHKTKNSAFDTGGISSNPVSPTKHY